MRDGPPAGGVILQLRTWHGCSLGRALGEYGSVPPYEAGGFEYGSVPPYEAGGFEIGSRLTETKLFFFPRPPPSAERDAPSYGVAK